MLPNFRKELLNGLQVFFCRMSAERIEYMDIYDEEPALDLFGEARPFTEPVPAFNRNKGSPLFTLIVDDRNRIVRFAVGHKSFPAGTGLRQLQLTSVASVTPFPARVLSSRVPARHQKRVRTGSSVMGLLPEGASRAVLEHLVVKYPEARRVVREAHESSRNALTALPEKQQFRIQQERDAAFTAMLIAGMDRKVHLREQQEPIAGDRWFLNFVAETRLREDAMLTNDLGSFPGFRTIKKHVSGAVRFEQNGVRLTVVLVNRQPLEELTGTDLIYYNETFNSFVMVQYKALEHDRDDHVFRLPNEGLAEEVSRMEKFWTELGHVKAAGTSPADFRLNRNPFFLKFCPRIVQQVTSTDLVPGMYFPLEHWLKLQSSDILNGPRGGRALRLNKTPPFTNAERYLNNTEFATLVSNAWVGTSIDQSKLLERVIQSTLEKGRSVTLASLTQIAEGDDKEDN